jgi:hypothetical protein
LPNFLKTVGWILVIAGIIAGVYLGVELVDWHAYSLDARFYAELPYNEFARSDYQASRAAMLSGLSLAVGAGIGASVPGLILIGLGEIVAAIRESTAATLALSEHMKGDRWRPVYAASRQEDDEDRT